MKSLNVYFTNLVQNCPSYLIKDFKRLYDVKMTFWKIGAEQLKGI